MDIGEWIAQYDLIYQGRLLLRIVLAAFVGYLIGFERMNREKNAGMRTHAIVCMGAALIMVVSKYSFRDIPDYDASRVAAQIVSGIGFLGAGIILELLTNSGIVQRNLFQIRCLLKNGKKKDAWRRHSIYFIIRFKLIAVAERRQ